MALVAGRWEVTYDLIDGTGKITTARRVLRAADADEAATMATAHLAKLMGVSDTICIGYVVGQKYADNAFGALPAVTVLNSVQAVISAAILDQPFKFASLQIPGPKIGVFTNTSGRGANIVNAAATIVTQYLTEFTEAGNAYISDGESLDPVFNATGERVTKYRRLGK